jgi:hypothetical protein
MALEGRLQLYAVTGTVGPVFASERLFTRLDFQSDKGLESAICSPSWLIFWLSHTRPIRAEELSLGHTRRPRLRGDLAQDLIGIAIQYSGLLSGPSITGPNGLEISLALIFTHSTALRFGLPVIGVNDAALLLRRVTFNLSQCGEQWPHCKK